MLALNASMMQIDERTLGKSKASIRAKVPIILALFNGQGGRMMLYRPGEEPEIAPPAWGR